MKTPELNTRWEDSDGIIWTLRDITTLAEEDYYHLEHKTQGRTKRSVVSEYSFQTGFKPCP